MEVTDQRFVYPVATLLALAIYLFAQTDHAMARDQIPDTTKDGLVLKHDTDLSAVYVKPGATLEAYQRVLILDPFVAFEKNWQRDYDRDHFHEQISDRDMQKIKEAVATEFKTVFSETLTEAGYTITDEVASDVLVLRPAIVNLRVTAPDASMSMTRTIVREAGSMTLYMEFYDAVTSAKFAEVIDTQVVGDRSFGYVATRGSNKMELDRTLRAWAKTLAERLNEAHDVVVR